MYKYYIIFETVHLSFQERLINKFDTYLNERGLNTVKNKFGYLTTLNENNYYKEEYYTELKQIKNGNYCQIIVETNKLIKFDNLNGLGFLTIISDILQSFQHVKYYEIEYYNNFSNFTLVLSNLTNRKIYRKTVCELIENNNYKKIDIEIKESDINEYILFYAEFSKNISISEFFINVAEKYGYDYHEISKTEFIPITIESFYSEIFKFEKELNISIKDKLIFDKESIIDIYLINLCREEIYEKMEVVIELNNRYYYFVFFNTLCQN